MSTAMIITVYLAAALVCAIISAVVAPSKGRHSGYWMIASFLFPPALLLLLLLRPGKGKYAHGKDPFLDSDDHDRFI